MKNSQKPTLVGWQNGQPSGLGCGASGTRGARHAALRSLLPGRWLPGRAECLEPLEHVGVTGFQPVRIRLEEEEGLGKELPLRISCCVRGERLDSGILDELIERRADSALCRDDMTQFVDIRHGADRQHIGLSPQETQRLAFPGRGIVDHHGEFAANAMGNALHVQPQSHPRPPPACKTRCTSFRTRRVSRRRFKGSCRSSAPATARAPG